MSRTERLFDLLQVLRRHRQPVTGRQLAAEVGISLRTLYRDMASLQALGADIEGEAGLGYVLKPGFLLPPLMFSPEEIEALVLGSRWVAQRADGPLGEAARGALGKIAAVLPPELRGEMEGSALLVGPGQALADAAPVDLTVIRQAIRRERKLLLVYADGRGSASERTVWPFALGFFDRVRVVVAWCELRQGFRHFRCDRIGALTVLDQRYPRRRQALLADWRRDQGIAPQA